MGPTIYLLGIVVTFACGTLLTRAYAKVWEAAAVVEWRLLLWPRDF